jgi:hypothetical protein
MYMYDKIEAQFSQWNVSSLEPGNLIVDVENVETAEASPLRHTLLINRLCPQSWNRQRVLVT